MGRIQRKKTSATKKKKSTSGVKQSIGAGVKKAAPGETASPGIMKKRALPAKKQPVATTVALKQKDNIFGKTAQFLREVKVELKKVTWPSRKQTIGSTVVVIALVMIISVFLGAVDLGLSSLIRIVLQ